MSRLLIVHLLFASVCFAEPKGSWQWVGNKLMFMPEAEIKTKTDEQGASGADRKVLSLELDRDDEESRRFDPYLSRVPRAKPVLLKKNRFHRDIPEESYKLKPQFQKGTLPKREEPNFDLQPIRAPVFTAGEVQSSQFRAWATQIHEKSQELRKRYDKIRRSQKSDRFSLKKSMNESGIDKMGSSDGGDRLAIRKYVIDAKAFREELRSFRNAVDIDQLRRKGSQ
jgi:hypothetical protein